MGGRWRFGISRDFRALRPSAAFSLHTGETSAARTATTIPCEDPVRALPTTRRPEPFNLVEETKDWQARPDGDDWTHVPHLYGLGQVHSRRERPIPVDCCADYDPAF